MVSCNETETAGLSHAADRVGEEVTMASDIFWLKYKLHSIDGDVNARYAAVLLDRRPQSSKCWFLRTGTCSLLTANDANAYRDEALQIQSKWDSCSAR